MNVLLIQQQGEIKFNNYLVNFMEKFEDALMPETAEPLLKLARYKTDLYFKEAGYIPCSSNQDELPTIEQFSLWGEVVQLMEMEEFGEKSLFLGKTYQKLWDERIVFSVKSKKSLNEVA